MSGTIAKPQMRRLLEAHIKKGLIGAVISCIASGIAWRFLVCEPRKKAYADFYKTYDHVKHLTAMCDAGLLQSCQPGSRIH